jgi:signal transduction histidine kinase
VKKRARRPPSKPRGQRKQARAATARTAAAPLRAENAALRDQQAATSEILRVISSSPNDVKPVFDTIVHSAKRLLGALTAVVTRLIGDELHLAALTTTDESADQELRGFYPQPVSGSSAHARAVRTLAPVNIGDTETDERLSDAGRKVARVRGYRSMLVVPIARNGKAVGTISVSRPQPGSFLPAEVGLLQTFADQAVIAIENARLLSELQASNRDLTTSLDRQTATSEVLRVISRSQTDVQPVFDAIVQNAVRLCGAARGTIYRFDGDVMHIDAQAGYDPDLVAWFKTYFPRVATRETPPGRAIVDRTVVVLETLDSAHAEGFSLEILGSRNGSTVAVPLLKDGEPIGAIGISRAEIRAFSETEIDLLKTFADQAVIAIENARLLTELQARTAELTRSVDQLTALGEVGQAVSSSLDVDTVLSTIVARAVQLAGADGGTLYEYDEGTESFELRATTNADDPVRQVQRTSRLRLGEGAVGRAGLSREAVQIADIAAEGAYDSRVRAALLRAGARALLAVPLLREERLLGGLVVSRRTTGEFAPEVVSVLKTFATQSALAIQNARLFREIEVKSRELEVASQHKSEFLANMSHELRTPLNAVIGFSEVLLERMFGDVNEKQAEYLDDIHTSAEHLLSLINDILDLSKIEAGRMELDVAEFDLPTAIDNALTLVRERAGRRAIALERAIDDRLGPVRGDERKIKQVLLNLLSNALKFTPEGGRVEVRAGVANGTAEISVTDTGIGIAPEDHDAVFEEFRQVGSSEKKAEGTGLGLSLSRRFIELHGGRIWVKSQVGVGSTFTFTLPFKDPV